MSKTTLRNVPPEDPQEQSEQINNAEEIVTNDNLLMAVSINLLYDGMLVQDDVYDSSGDRLLIANGSVLDDTQIERVKRLNSGSSTIYVTGRTHKSMLAKRPNIDIEVRHEVEESTG